MPRCWQTLMVSLCVRSFARNRWSLDGVEMLRLSTLFHLSCKIEIRDVAQKRESSRRKIMLLDEAFHATSSEGPAQN